MDQLLDKKPLTDKLPKGGDLNQGGGKRKTRRKRKRKRSKSRKRKRRTRKKHGKGFMHTGEHHLQLQHFQKLNEDEVVLNDEETTELGDLRDYYVNRALNFKKSNPLSQIWQEKLKTKYKIVINLVKDFNKRRMERAREERERKYKEDGVDEQKLKEETERARADSNERRRKNKKIMNNTWRELTDGLVNKIILNVDGFEEEDARRELLKGCDGNRPWLCLWKNVNKMKRIPNSIKEDLRTFFKNTLVDDGDKNVKEIWCTIWGEWQASSSGEGDGLGGCEQTGGRRKKRKKTRRKKRTKKKARGKRRRSRRK